LNLEIRNSQKLVGGGFFDQTRFLSAYTCNTSNSEKNKVGSELSSFFDSIFIKTNNKGIAAGWRRGSVLGP
jgi:hypothetical protein